MTATAPASGRSSSSSSVRPWSGAAGNRRNADALISTARAGSVRPSAVVRWRLIGRAAPRCSMLRVVARQTATSCRERHSSLRRCAFQTRMPTMRSALATGRRGLIKSCINSRYAAPAPMAIASAVTATTVRPGDFTSIRAPSFRSIGQPASQRNDRASRCCSLACSTPPNVRLAAYRASSRLIPSATCLSSSSCRCALISRDRSDSAPLGRNRVTSRRRKRRTLAMC